MMGEKESEIWVYKVAERVRLERRVFNVAHEPGWEGGGGIADVLRL